MSWELQQADVGEQGRLRLTFLPSPPIPDAKVYADALVLARPIIAENIKEALGRLASYQDLLGLQKSEQAALAELEALADQIERARGGKRAAYIAAAGIEQAEASLVELENQRRHVIQRLAEIREQLLPTWQQVRRFANGTHLEPNELRPLATRRRDLMASVAAVLDPLLSELATAVKAESIASGDLGSFALALIGPDPSENAKPIPAIDTPMSPLAPAMLPY